MTKDNLHNHEPVQITVLAEDARAMPHRRYVAEVVDRHIGHGNNVEARQCVHLYKENIVCSFIMDISFFPVSFNRTPIYWYEIKKLNK